MAELPGPGRPPGVQGPPPFPGVGIAIVAATLALMPTCRCPPPGKKLRARSERTASAAGRRAHMSIMDSIEKGFATRQLGRLQAGQPHARLVGPAERRSRCSTCGRLRDDLRQFNLYDTRGRARRRAPPGAEELPKYRTYDGSFQDPADPEMGKVGTRFGRNAPPDATAPEPMPQLMEPEPARGAHQPAQPRHFKPATTPERAGRLLDPVPEPRLVRPRRELPDELHRRAAARGRRAGPTATR